MADRAEILANIDAYVAAARKDLRRVRLWLLWAVLLYLCAVLNLGLGVHSLVQFDRTGSLLSLAAAAFNGWAFVHSLRSIERNKKTGHQLTTMLRQRIEDAQAVRERVMQEPPC